MSSIPVKCFPYGVDSQTGICFGLQLGPYRILLDCGLADISRLQKSLTLPDDVFDQKSSEQPADFVLCSQAHTDHAGGLETLHRHYSTLPIYTSTETQQLLSHLSANEWTSACNTVAWNTPLALSTDLTIEFIPAGRLPGAAVCLLTYTTSDLESDRPKSYTVAYTGDFYLTHTRFAPALPTACLKGRSIDLLIIKGGYGTLQHPPRKQQESEFIQTFLRALAAKQSILIPVPQLGLGQEILMLLRTHAEFTRQTVTVWVDESVAKGCDAYAQILSSLPSAIQNFAHQQSLFWQSTGRLQVRKFASNSQLPCILLVHNQACLKSYARTLGDQVLVMEPTLPEYPQALCDVPSNTALETASLPSTWETQSFLLAQACDGPSTTQLIHNIRPRHVAFYHRSPLVVEDLTQIADLQHRYQLHPLTRGERLELTQDFSFPQSHGELAPPIQTYAGELVEAESAVTLSLSAHILDDPRWQTFADTGLIEAVWQGHQLVIRGLSQAELLRSSASQQTLDSNRTCCANCHYYRNQRCWQSESALYGFKVSPQGVCPVYEPVDASAAETGSSAAEG